MIFVFGPCSQCVGHVAYQMRVHGFRRIYFFVYLASTRSDWQYH